MKFQVIVHDAEEGGFWAEVPALPGCATEGETMDELMLNIADAIQGCLAVDIDQEIASHHYGSRDRYKVLEVAV
jgi:predicted RNase H-like HicB family nuclease